MNRFFDSLTPDQLTDVEDPPGFGKVTKVAWGGRETSSVSDDDHGDFDAANPPCTSSDRDMDVNSALNDKDLSADEDDIDSEKALASCASEAGDDEDTRTIKRSKVHLVKARAHIINGDRAEALKAVNTAYGHLDRYHKAMKAAAREG